MLRRRAADALQDGDAPHLLLDEDAGDARDADPAEDQHDQSDQAEIVLGARQVLPHAIGVRPVAAAADELVGERRAQIRLRLHRAVASHQQQELTRRPAAERQQPGRWDIGVIDQDARPDAERADVPAGLLLDDAANLERLGPDEDPIANRQLQLRQQLRPDQHAAAAKQLMRVAARFQRQRAVEREPAAPPPSFPPS